MDGVLIDSMKHHVYSWRKAFDKMGIKTTERELLLREGMSFKETIYSISKKNKINLSKEKRDKIYKFKKQIIAKNFPLKVYEDVEDFVKYLKKKNFNLGLVTGSSKEFARSIININFPDIFDVIITGDDVDSSKPDPEPYLKAIRKMKLKKQEALVIENAPMGIESAKRAGLKVFAVETTLGKEDLKKADKIFRNHNELFEFFKKME